jgi:hypothetical protein
MKTIPLKTACYLLDKANGLSLYSACQDVNYHSWGFSDDSDEEFLTVDWTDDLGHGKVRFIERDNHIVTIVGEEMFLIAENGNKERIKLYFKFVNLEDFVDSPEYYNE